ncbi:MAG TPA: MMPL family transporter, partial [Acidimicrobiales bacterium]|nr:MMPL family transporter [Acidimicrobiales bacterium]
MRMQRFWSKLAVELGRRAGLVSLIGLIVTLGLGYGITQLKVETSQDSYLNQTDEVYLDSVAYQDLFGGQAMLTLVTMDEGHTIDELFTEENRAQFDEAAEALRADEAIQSVITPVDVMEFNAALVDSDTGDPTQSIAGGALLRATTADPDEEGRAARQADAVVTLERLNAIPPDERNLDNPDWVDFLLRDNEGEIRLALRSFFPDETHAQVITRLPGNASIDEEGVGADVTKEILGDLEFENASVVTTGAPVLLQDINDYLTGGILTLGAIAAAIMMVILLLFFNVRWRLLPLGVIALGIIWAFGTAGYLGIPLTIVTIAGLPVMMGIGIDYAIQMHARVEEEVVIDHQRHPIQETARKLGPALLVVTFDAVFAFLALRFAKVPMIRDFGLLLAIGIAIICLCSIVMTLAALGIREFRSPTTGTDFREGKLAHLVVWLGSIPAWSAIPFAIMSIAVFFGGLAVEDDLTLQADPIKWVNQDSQVIRDINTIDEETGSSSELGIYVQSEDVFSDENVQFMHEFTQQQLEEYPQDLL